MRRDRILDDMNTTTIRNSIAALALMTVLAPSGAFAQSAPPTTSDAMHADTMKPTSAALAAMADATKVAKKDLAMQKQLMAMKGMDPKITAAAKKRAEDDAAYIAILMSHSPYGGDS